MWPTIHTQMPDVEVHIAGRSTPNAIAAYHDGIHVIVHGEIEDPTAFRSAYSVGIVPLLSGSGVRIKKAAEPIARYLTPAQRTELIEQMFVEMKNAARDLDFERAAELRDDITRLQALNDA